MNTEILLITPPFTQLNTPYPATAYLKGYLNRVQVSSAQADLSLEVILSLFSASGLRNMFGRIAAEKKTLSENCRRMVALKEQYIETVDLAVSFLQGGEQSLATRLADRSFLPEASRFARLDDLEWAFGTMGSRDQARHLITLYLEDLSDLIVEAVDPEFGFSRYAEHLGRSAGSFDSVEEALLREPSFIDHLMLERLQEKIKHDHPAMVALSVPFPGNLYSALRCAWWLKRNHPHISVAMGGGFASTELRSLADARIFDYVDYVILDDGEVPLLRLNRFLQGRAEESDLVRTYYCREGKVCYAGGDDDTEETPAGWADPDYSGLPLDRYLSVIEMVNPMHKLWSDGRWNKLTLAHGCYWGKCSFCDGSLPYIGCYRPLKAAEVADRMERLVAETGERGFHFVDEAAPPALLRELAFEILRRKLKVSWWTNVRFEKSYTPDLCFLLRQSGCIAVSGGLEVASDRLLKLINKGVTVGQVARVTDAFTAAGIMVHAYLMYGFPTQTAQETIDSLEVVRQLFENGLVQSAFWHRFALTAHSPAGISPQRYGICPSTENFGGFARNDLEFTDPQGADHDQFTTGLNKSLYNYMHGAGFDVPLQKWFDGAVPKTLIPPRYIARTLDEPSDRQADKTKRIVWIGDLPQVRTVDRPKKGKVITQSEWRFYLLSETVRFSVPPDWSRWFEQILPELMLQSAQPCTMATLEQRFAAAGLGVLAAGLASTPMWRFMRENGLLLL